MARLTLMRVLMNKLSQTESDQIEPTERPWLFQPGQSGNPGGRPKGQTFAQRARKAMEAAGDEIDWGEYVKILDGLAKQAADPKDKLAAIKALREWSGVDAAQQVAVVAGTLLDVEAQAALIE